MKHLNDISENLDKYLDSAKSSSTSNENKRLSNYEKFVSFYKMKQDTINIVLSTNVLDAEYDKIISMPILQSDIFNWNFYL